jgi:hypothetical protein
VTPRRERRLPRGYSPRSEEELDVVTRQLERASISLPPGVVIGRDRIIGVYGAALRRLAELVDEDETRLVDGFYDLGDLEYRSCGEVEAERRILLARLRHALTRQPRRAPRPRLLRAARRRGRPQRARRTRRARAAPGSSPSRRSRGSSARAAA